MANTTRFRHRSRARRLETVPSHRHADASSNLAQRDLLAGILDAATEDRDLEKYLSQVVVHLGKYSKCSCIGVLLFEKAAVAACTSCHGAATEFQRIPRGSFPGSETCICNAMVRVGTDTHPPHLTKGGAFFRNSKPDASARAETAEVASGVCIGSTFESVGIIPVKYPKTVAGFILVGDERKDRISPRMVRFLERVGTYVGNAVHALEAQRKRDQPGHDLPGQAEETATTSRDSDEMELVIRLIENPKKN
jgi:transcriptional regulator with GAF, ATPase, and Fis domain